MPCENSIDVPVCGLTLKVDPAEFPAGGVTQEEVQQMIEDALAGFTGGVVIPDYANMESENRISAWDGTWTADRAGFVHCCTCQGSSGLSGTVKINDKNAAAITTSGGGHALSVVLAVAKGDVIKLTGANYGSIRPYCYFVPPKAV